jgi:RHH-type proline utilization regulon transcriptional repressor/proline dehydrogenase/delta 1-pyrroline-5-carboxylate dehydrogenase
VSEAIDFANWAAVSTRALDDLVADGVDARPLGVVLVAGPWNFPTAIPANGLVAALAAGNAVLLKPAPEVVATAAELVRHVHDAGVPPEVVQLVCCPDDDTGRHLVTHPGVDGIVLTGSYDTARLFLGWKPDLHLLAETSGKNALVITQTADVDAALRDLVRSAFGHAGQKCSAASLAIVEGPLHDDPLFQERLADAVRSLRIGPATDLATMVGPLIAPPTGPLARALAELDAGERWLVTPEPLDDTGRLWSPGVRLGVRPGSWFHQTECFGPVLGVMRADDLDHAVRLQNGVAYGLTGGLHSLDEDEIARWLDRVEVGNVYVNRHTTGAIVRRQPFGGWKRSSVGRGAKTGGPDDIMRFATFRRREAATAAEAEASYRRWWAERYGVATDRSGLRSEADVLRYRPVRGVIARVGPETTDADIASLRAAAAVAGVALTVSGPGGDTVEDDPTLAARLGRSDVERLRLLTTVDHAVLVACHAAGIAVDTTAITHDGRIELPCWLREQAISRTRHRHGRVPKG